MKINRPSQKMPDSQSGDALSYSDISEMYDKFQDSHRNVFMEKFSDQLFFYRSLGRSEYHTILKDDRFTDLEKEELICETCTVWPEEFDFEDCDAGIPTELARAILKNSFLESSKSRKIVLNHYRSEMYELDNQITCIINEAFPQYDIEEIEEWDMEKTAKYLSRAEWKLHNLRGLEFYEPEIQDEEYSQEVEEAPKKQAAEKKEKNHRGGDKEKMTPEKLRELQEKFPEIDWSADVIANEGIDGMRDSVDTVSPALRPGF